MIPESKKKKFSDLVIEQSKELLGYTPEQRSAENLKWMLQNGYFTKKQSKIRKSRK
jgi:hypothetical protein